MPAYIDRPFRHELKYYINQGDAQVLSRRLSLTMDRDQNADEYGEYHIRSLYFDDTINSAVRDKLDGVDERKKYRIRIYNLSDEVISLECKQKVGQYIHKRSMRIDRQLCEELCMGEYGSLLHLEAPLAREMYYQMSCRMLRPAVIVDYVREAFVAPYQDVRITFDKDLRTGVFSKDIFDPEIPTVRAMEGYDMILEVKFNKFLPEYYHRLVQVDASMHSAVSKYVICRKFE